MVYIFNSLGYTPKCRIAGFYGASQVAQPIYQYKTRKRVDWIPGSGDTLKETTATHPSILAGEARGWRRLHGGLQPLGSQRVRHNWSILAHSTRGNSLYFTFWEMVVLFFKAAPFYIPYKHCVKNCDFSTSSPTPFIIFFITAGLVCVKWYHCGFSFVFPWIDVEHLVMCLLAMCIFFGEMSIQILCSFKKNFFLLLSCRSSHLTERHGSQIFSPILWIVFSLSW